MADELNPAAGEIARETNAHILALDERFGDVSAHAPHSDLIDLFSRDRKLQRVIARAHATAVSDSLTLKSDTIDLRMKGDLLDQLQAAGLGAASPLYTKFADGIRSLLRNKLDGADPEEGVGTVLETVAVAIRERRIRTLDQLPSQIRAAVNSYVHQARAAGALRARAYSNELPRILTDLSPEARACLEGAVSRAPQLRGHYT